MSRSALTLSCLLALLAASCVDEEASKSYGDPTSLGTPSQSAGIVAWLESPTIRNVSTASLELVIGAHTEGNPEQLSVSVGIQERAKSGSYQTVSVQTAQSEGEPGPAQRFRAPVALTHGLNQLVVRIENADKSKVRTLSFTLRYEGTAPGVLLGMRTAEAGKDPCTEGSELVVPLTNKPEICAWGRITTSGASLAGAQLSVLGSPAQVVNADASGAFAVRLPLPADQSSQLVLDARDAAGGQSLIKLFVTSDQTPPTVAFTTNSTETSSASMDLTGTAEDAHGIAQIELLGQGDSRRQLENTSPFSTNVQLAWGLNNLRVVARDVAGNEAEALLAITRTRLLSLGAPQPNVGTTRIEMTKQDLLELLTETDQKSIELVAIDLAPSVKQTLMRIRTPERYGVKTNAWGDAERNMQRILNMTPDAADLSGTSMAKLLEISAAVGLPPARMLSDLLNLTPTDFILDLDVATEVIVERLLGTHPNIGHDANNKPVLTVSMYDVLHDLSTIAPRFAAAGPHPGFLTGSSYSKVLESGFLLTLPVHSNLVQYDAIDLSRASKDYLFLLEGERVLDFNVLTDEFEVVGLADEPTVDLTFIMKEWNGMARAGNNRTAAPDPSAPGFFRGNGNAFTLAPYLFEHIASEIGYRQLRRSFEAEGYHRVLRYDAGSIKNAAVIDWNRGWADIQTAGNLGSPPPPQYAWDTLCEVAQVRLHDQGIAEGNAAMAFSLENLPIGLTADQLVEKLRPKLHEQENKLSEILAGETGLAQSRADIYFAPSEQGGALLFRIPEDGGGAVTYTQPGFYAEPALTTKLSSKAPAFGIADDKHEKVSAAAGGLFYARDEDGKVYELKIVSATSDGIQAQVRPIGGAQ